MTDRPILFSAPMVRALLAGTKTQTRRLVKPQPDAIQDIGLVLAERPLRISVGDRLWVKENIRPQLATNFLTGEPIPECWEAAYDANGEGVLEQAGFNVVPWWNHNGRLPCIHMPRWASRLTLHVTDVRVQQLHDIDRDDAKAEGIPEFWDQAGRLGLPGAANDNGHVWDNRTTVENYRALWEHINGPDSWNANPWVAAYTFSVELANITRARVAA